MGLFLSLNSSLSSNIKVIQTWQCNRSLEPNPLWRLCYLCQRYPKTIMLLREVYINNCDLTRQDFEIICGDIANNININMLDLPRNRLGDHCGMMVGKLTSFENIQLSPRDKSENLQSHAISSFSLFFLNDNSHMNTKITELNYYWF